MIAINSTTGTALWEGPGRLSGDPSVVAKLEEMASVLAFVSVTPTGPRSFPNLFTEEGVLAAASLAGCTVTGSSMLDVPGVDGPNAIDADFVRKVIAKHLGPGPHPSGSEQTVHGRPFDFDDPDNFMALAGEIFETEIEVEGVTYRSQVDGADSLWGNGVVQGQVTVKGTIRQGQEQVGTFIRTLNSDGTVLNEELYLKPSETGKGIGHTFAHHWEANLRAAGFTRMELYASDIGRYVWALEGYELMWTDSAFSDRIIDHVVAFDEYRGKKPLIQAWHREEKPKRFDIPADSPAWDELAQMVDNYSRSGELPQVLDIAMLGARHPGPGGWHLGKFILLSGPEWMGEKALT